MTGLTRNDRIEPDEAWVVFSGAAELWWLRLLKPGFRHCFFEERARCGPGLAKNPTHCLEIRF